VIFNEISDPDTHGLSLSRAEAFCDHLGQVPTINHPKSVRRTTRDELSKRLNGIGGVVAPKTERCQLTDPNEIAILAEQLGLKYPLLVRVAGAHGGKTLVKLESPDHVAPVHALPLDGRDFYLTEYHDFRSKDGLYRKYRLVVVNGKPFIRHMIANDDWLIHAADVSFAADKPEMQNEEEELITSFEQSLSPRIEQAICTIHEATEMDYFGIDCGISDDGELVLFEVNANMNVLVNSRPTPNVSEVAIDRIVNALRQLVLSKVRS
jgi:glutathione synthase/RimK-type ligase-like ATP-grasp enzyme